MVYIHPVSCKAGMKLYSACVFKRIQRGYYRIDHTMCVAPRSTGAPQILMRYVYMVTMHIATWL